MTGQIPDYQIRITEQHLLTGWLKQGQSCAVVGPSNIGKSTLLRSLASERNLKEFSLHADAGTALVFVDCLTASRDESAFYELLLRQVVSCLPGGMVPASTITALKANHAEMLHGATEVAMRSLFESSLKTLGLESRIHLVIILDELDDALLSLSPWPFRSLRALRDEWQGRLAYVFSTSRRLERIRPDASLYEFREMSHANTLMLRPLSQSEALICLQELMQNCQIELDELQQKVVLTLAGGHPGFIKRITLTIPQVLPQPSTDEDWVHRLQSLWAIQQESQHLWDELEVEEQDALLAYTTTGFDHLDDLQRRSLESRGLLAPDQTGKLMIFNPLFNTYLLNRLARLRNMDTQGVQCDFDSGKIWVDGKDITLELSDLQRKLLRFMYQRANTVCTYQEIREAVWGAGEGITTSAIYELIKRSREKLGDSTLNPQHLVTVRGEGCMLKLPG